MNTHQSQQPYQGTNTNVNANVNANSAVAPQAAAGADPGFTVAPMVDIYQNTDEFLLIADLPGVSDDGLRIDYERGQISIEGRPKAREHGGTQLFGVRARPTFARTFSIPGTIDVGRIEATLKQGVLQVKLPKMEQAKPRQIPVKLSAT